MSNVLIVGDSIIYRHLIEKEIISWPEFLFLKEKTVINAKGFRTFNFFLKDNVYKNNFDFCIIQLGIVDVFTRFKNPEDIQKGKFYEMNGGIKFKNIIENLINNKYSIKSNNYIFISITIPPKKYTVMKKIDYHDLLSKNINYYNNYLKKMSEKYSNVYFIDINKILQSYPKSIEYFCFDGSGHLNYDNKIIKDYSKLIFDEIKKNLKLFNNLKKYMINYN